MTAFPVHVLDSGKTQINIPFTGSQEVKETENKFKVLQREAIPTLAPCVAPSTVSTNTRFINKLQNESMGQEIEPLAVPIGLQK